MNRILNSIKKSTKLTAVIIFIILIVSCGGGGGDASSKVELKKDYTPDSAKLAITAQSSIDLYVEPNFNFNSHQKVIFNINVTNSEGEPMTNKVLSISSIHHEVEAYDDPRLQEKALLAMTKTDNDGQVYLTLEIPQSISNILLELNAVGIENEVIRLIDESGIVMYHFQQNN